MIQIFCGLNCKVHPAKISPSLASSKDLNPKSSMNSLMLRRSKGWPVNVWLRARKYLYLIVLAAFG